MFDQGTRKTSLEKILKPVIHPIHDSWVIKTDLTLLRILILNQTKVLDVGILDGVAKQKMVNWLQIWNRLELIFLAESLVKSDPTGRPCMKMKFALFQLQQTQQKLMDTDITLLLVGKEPVLEILDPLYFVILMV